MSLPIRLLVSVRNAVEAEIAASNGVDVIDFKEPNRGALGMVQPEILDTAIRLVLNKQPSLTVSVACGEVQEWGEPASFELSGVDYLKIGLAGLRGDVNWVEKWLQCREMLSQSVKRANGTAPGWVAVIYADEDLAQSPPAEAIIDAAGKTRCAGVLIDTATKQGGGVFNYLTQGKIEHYRDLAHQQGMFFALAGKLSLADMTRIRQVRSDFVAIRSAACRDGNRIGEICGRTLSEFREQLSAGQTGSVS
ncbi:(5-formylfuran-3-yl)methyl phosphate synthase [Planctomicrobium sp. SH527]|uniref:(5-formylfuran-3-yl)methyl phosphate synthase n=1 Tax=Planctomicrobium sp. SH527 TaxID=3448123 RepID=UPI003F5B0CA4